MNNETLNSLAIGYAQECLKLHLSNNSDNEGRDELLNTYLHDYYYAAHKLRELDEDIDEAY